MIWLGLEQNSTQAIYLDIYHTESRPTQPSSSFFFSATVGNGTLEGEVSVEIGDQPSVSFADMLPDSGLPQLLQLCGADSLKKAILQACQGVEIPPPVRCDRVGSQQDRSQMHLFKTTVPPMVREASPLWGDGAYA